MDLLDTHLYATLGEEGLTKLVAAFYRRVPTDDILGKLYPKHDLVGAEKRLRDFLVFRFGGPDTYIRERGHPKLRMRHAPFAVTQAGRDRWVSLMEAAMEEVRTPEEARPVLRKFFNDAATFMINQPSPPYSGERTG
jgi:hemoglobin